MAWRRAPPNPIMGYTLRPGVTCCQAGGFTFFLDRDGDRYFAIGGETHAAFNALLNGVSADTDRHVIGLIGEGLLILTPGEERPSICGPVDRAERSAVDLADRLVRRPAFTAALARVVWARTALRSFGLAQSLKRLEARIQRTDVRPAAPDELAWIAASFERCNAIAKPLDQCLPRSIAAAHRLLDVGLRPTFFMGVRAQPFGAHAWVESAGLIVNDRFDTVYPYTPILAL